MRILLLFFMMVPASLFGYVISVADWGLTGAQKCKKIVVLGDAHIGGKESKKHFAALKKELAHLSLQSTSTLLALEDRGWDFLENRYIDNTLPDLCRYTRKQKSSFKNLTVDQADIRGKKTTWATECAEDIESGIGYTKKSAKQLNAIVAHCARSVAARHGTAPTVKQYTQEVQKVIDELKDCKYPSLDFVIMRLTKDFSTVAAAGSNLNPSDSFVQLFQEVARRGSTHLQALLRAIIEVDTTIADGGFIMDIWDSFQEFDTLIFFGGQAHAHAINQALKHDTLCVMKSYRGCRSRLPLSVDAMPLAESAFMPLLRKSAPFSGV